VSVLRGFAIVIASAIGFAVWGGGVGYALGRFVPSYYRFGIPDGRSPDFDPVQFGVASGVAQGAIAGVFVGSIVVLAVAVAGSRRRMKETLDHE